PRSIPGSGGEALDGDLGAGRSEDLTDQRVHGGLDAGPEVVDARSPSIQRALDGDADVLDEQEVPGLPTVAVDKERLAAKGAREEAGDDARLVRGERAVDVR